MTEDAEDAFLLALAASQKALLVGLGRPRLEIAVPPDHPNRTLAELMQAFCQHVLDDLFDQWEAEVSADDTYEQKGEQSC